MAKRNRKTGQTIAYKTLHRKLKTKVLRNGKQFRLHYIASVVLQTMISYDWGGGDWIVITTNGTYRWSLQRHLHMEFVIPIKISLVEDCC